MAGSNSFSTFGRGSNAASLCWLFSDSCVMAHSDQSWLQWTTNAQMGQTDSQNIEPSYLKGAVVRW